MCAIRVVIADDDRGIRKSLRTLLRIEGDMDIIGEAADGLEAKALVRDLQPDVVLMDVEMPRMDGIEATRRIKHETPGTRVIVISVYETNLREACEAGADSFVLKDCGRTRLVEEIRRTVPAPVGRR